MDLKDVTVSDLKFKPLEDLSYEEALQELEELVNQFLDEAGVADKVQMLIGDSLKIIPTLPDLYDLVFIDANKEHYVQYYELLIDKVRPGAYIIADNVLWGGKVVEDPEQDESTSILHQFNEIVTADPRVENVFLTVRDGLMLIRKC